MTSSLIKCNGAGGFGIFFDNNNLINLLSQLSVVGRKVDLSLYEGTNESIHIEETNESIKEKITDYTSQNKGFKLLQTNAHFRDEINGLILAKDTFQISYFNEKKPGFKIHIPIKSKGNSTGSSSDDPFKFTVVYDINGVQYTKHVCCFTLYFVMMDKLQTLEEVINEKKRQVHNLLLDISQYNTFCLNQIINPLMTQLSKMHASKHFHQDIKPANIMFTPKGEATFIDYGLLRPERECEFGTGTIYFISPGSWHGSYLKTDKDFDDLDIKNIFFNMKPGLPLSIYNFFKYRSLQSYQDNWKTLKRENLPVFKRYLLMKNDQYALGLSIQKMCGALIPNIPVDIPQIKKLHDASKLTVKFTATDGDNYTNKQLTPEEANNIILLANEYDRFMQSGGVRKKSRMVKRVFGKNRVVYKKKCVKGYNNQNGGSDTLLYVNLGNKDVPLADALRFEEKLKREFTRG